MKSQPDAEVRSGHKGTRPLCSNKRRGEAAKGRMRKPLEDARVEGCPQYPANQRDSGQRLNVLQRDPFAAPAGQDERGHMRGRPRRVARLLGKPRSGRRGRLSIGSRHPALKDLFPSVTRLGRASSRRKEHAGRCSFPWVAYDCRPLVVWKWRQGVVADGKCSLLARGRGERQCLPMRGGKCSSRDGLLGFWRRGRIYKSHVCKWNPRRAASFRLGNTWKFW